MRAALPGAGERLEEIRELHARVMELEGWPESLERAPFQAVDHTEVFGLEGLQAAIGVVSELVAGGVVSGGLVARGRTRSASGDRARGRRGRYADHDRMGADRGQG